MDTEERGPGRPRRLSKTLLVEAGARAVQERFRRRQRLEDVLGVRLREISAAADEVYRDQYGELPEPPISNATVYRSWGSKENYLRDVFASMFQPPPDAEVGQLLLGRPEEPWEDVLADWVDSDQAHAAELGPVFLLGFIAAGSGDESAREAVASVYTGFDAVIVPVLRQFLSEHRLKVQLPPGSGDQEDGVAALAQMLTAVTEGWFLRNRAQPAISRTSSEGRSPWATQAILIVAGATTSA
jgi:AcrR family transcriptional regulator